MKNTSHHMEREGHNHYDDQDSYNNRSHRRSMSHPRYEEEDYNYCYDEPEDNYFRLRLSLHNSVHSHKKERSMDT